MNLTNPLVLPISAILSGVLVMEVSMCSLLGCVAQLVPWRRSEHSGANGLSYVLDIHVSGV